MAVQTRGFQTVVPNFEFLDPRLFVPDYAGAGRGALAGLGQGVQMVGELDRLREARATEEARTALANLQPVLAQEQLRGAKTRNALGALELGRFPTVAQNQDDLAAINIAVAGSQRPVIDPGEESFVGDDAMDMPTIRSWTETVLNPKTGQPQQRVRQEVVETVAQKQERAARVAREEAVERRAIAKDERDIKKMEADAAKVGGVLREAFDEQGRQFFQVVDENTGQVLSGGRGLGFRAPPARNDFESRAAVLGLDLEGAGAGAQNVAGPATVMAPAGGGPLAFLQPGQVVDLRGGTISGQSLVGAAPGARQPAPAPTEQPDTAAAGSLRTQARDRVDFFTKGLGAGNAATGSRAPTTTLKEPVVEPEGIEEVETATVSEGAEGGGMNVDPVSLLGVAAFVPWGQLGGFVKSIPGATANSLKRARVLAKIYGPQVGARALSFGKVAASAVPMVRLGGATLMTSEAAGKLIDTTFGTSDYLAQQISFFMLNEKITDAELKKLDEDPYGVEARFIRSKYGMPEPPPQEVDNSLLPGRVVRQ